MVKNDIREFEITDISETGNGLGRTDNIVVFVPKTAVGDTVRVRIIKVNKSYCIGKLLQIVVPSRHRTVPDCECFSKCGGCAFRHMTYESELELKRKRVGDCINRIARIDIAPNPIVSDHNVVRYRNKAQFPVGPSGETGFFAPHSHRIVPVSDCLLQPAVFRDLTEAFKEWMRESGASHYDSETGTGLVRHLYIRSGRDESEIMVVIVCNGDALPDRNKLVSFLTKAVGDRLKCVYINVNKQNNNVILGKKNILIFGKGYITDSLCGISVRLSPNSFYQVNRNMAELLYQTAKEYAAPAGKTLLDLYCGTGTIGLTMAKECEMLIGVEIIEDAVADARRNAHDNGIANARFICGDALAAAVRLSDEGVKPDAVILDPPRKGCDRELIEIVANRFCPGRVVYVSCDPATLARDISIFQSLGYRLIEYTPFDLFPRTAHVETVCLLTSEKGQKGVESSADMENCPTRHRQTVPASVKKLCDG